MLASSGEVTDPWPRSYLGGRLSLEGEECGRSSTPAGWAKPRIAALRVLRSAIMTASAPAI
jgi:hypothetical protein